MSSQARATALLDGVDEALLVAVVEQAVRRLGGDPLTGLSDAALTDSLAQLHRLETCVHAEKLRRLAEVEEREAYRGQGCRSTADLAARRLKLTHGEARAMASTATALEALPATAARLRAGELGAGQAQVAARALAEAPPEARAELDRLVSRQGPRTDRRRLRESVDTWLHSFDAGILEDREEAAWQRRRAGLTNDPDDGSVRVHARLDPVGGAMVRAAFAALSRPTGVEDSRTFAQRQADALVELARRALDGGDLPEVAAQRPHVILIARADTADDVPGAPPGHLDGYGPVSGLTAQLITCDADITTVTMSRNGDVLDAGRTRRQPTRRQRAGVLARDRRCVGCGAPAARCQVHHVTFWSDGGRTDLDNLCLLCFSCHHQVHHAGWKVVLDGDGRFRVHTPTTRRPRHTR